MSRRKITMTEARQLSSDILARAEARRAEAARQDLDMTDHPHAGLIAPRSTGITIIIKGGDTPCAHPETTNPSGASNAAGSTSNPSSSPQPTNRKGWLTDDAKDELLAGAIEDIEAAKQRRVLTEAMLDRVQRERDELRKDKERLDWLEANLGYIMVKSKEEGKRHNLILCTPIRAGEPHPRTLRSAIDAALTPTL